jgi:hypothetical protein
MRVAALVVFGPVHQPDSSSFIYAASMMLKGSEWLSFADISLLRGNDMTLRMLGYPLLIAGLQWLFGVHVEYAVVILQSICSIVATGLVFRTARVFDLGLAVSCFAALAHTSSIAYLFDFNILVDSIYANGLLISACLLALGFRSGCTPGYWQLLAIGLLPAAAFLVRETALVFVPIWAIGVVIWARQVRASWLRSLMYVLIFILPVLLASTAYREWNRYRTGVPFLTTGAQFTMWFGPVEVARKHGVDLFADDSRMAEAIALALRADPDFPMTGAIAINHYFFAQGLKATDIAGLAFKAYVMALKAAPVTLVLDRLTRYRPRAVLLLVNASLPLEAMKDFSEKRDNIPFWGRGRAAIATGGMAGVATLLWMAVEIVQLGISAVLLLAFAAGIPLLTICSLLQSRRVGGTLLVLGWFWCMYWAMNGAYILVSYEGRYAMATLPLACLGGLWVCFRGLQVSRSARNAS